MIVKLTLTDKNNKEYKMLFGNSYKKWHDQMIEYLGRYFCSNDKGWNYTEMTGHIIAVEVSKSSWKGWGGLKWCSEENFQQELNREGCQQNDPDNKNPRQYSEMVFVKKPISFAEKYIEKEFGIKN